MMRNNFIYTLFKVRTNKMICKEDYIINFVVNKT